MKVEFDLPLAEVIPRLAAELELMRKDPDRSQLNGVNSDDAYEMGYAACLTDLKLWTGPDPSRGGALETLRRTDPAAAKRLEDRYK